MCSGRVNSSCSISDTYVILDTKSLLMKRNISVVYGHGQSRICGGAVRWSYRKWPWSKVTLVTWPEEALTRSDDVTWPKVTWPHGCATGFPALLTGTWVSPLLGPFDRKCFSRTFFPRTFPPNFFSPYFFPLLFFPYFFPQYLFFPVLFFPYFFPRTFFPVHFIPSFFHRTFFSRTFFPVLFFSRTFSPHFFPPYFFPILFFSVSRAFFLL